MPKLPRVVHCTGNLRGMDNEDYASLKKDLEMLKEKWRSQERREVLLSRQLLVYACIIAVRQLGHGCVSVSMQCIHGCGHT